MLTRRSFLALAAAAATAGGARAASADATAVVPATAGTPHAAVRFASGVQIGEDRHALVVVDADGRVVRQDALPGRAHGAASHIGRGLSVVFARRPGEWFALFDGRANVPPVRIALPADRRALGHGEFSADGRWLHVVENDFDAPGGPRGTLGIHDVADPTRVRRVAELATHGIGPHDILHVPGTDLYVVANGGIATRPDTEREKLNLADMRPSVALLRASPDARDALLAEWALPDAWHRISLRHLALSADGRIWIGGQDERDETDRATRAPLVVTAELADGLRAGGARLALDPVALPDAAHDALGGYVSSIDATSGAVVVTSSRGGSALLLDARTRGLRAALELGDCSGVAATDDATLPWRLTNGRGDFVAADELGLEPRATLGFAWDNHLTRIA